MIGIKELLLIVSAGLIITVSLLVYEKMAGNKVRSEMAVLNAEIQTSYDGIIEGWASALDMRDHESAGHSRRVSSATVELAYHIGLRGQDLLDVKRGALLHDIGKICVPDRILLKPGPLDEAEWRIMKKHPEDAAFLLSSISYLGKAVDIPYYHHEKWDGTGYPKGLKGEEIPLAARIFAVIDVWDALLSPRPYRQAWSMEEAKKYLQGKSGIEFDPAVISAFMEYLPHIETKWESEGERIEKSDRVDDLETLRCKTTDRFQAEQTLLLVDDLRSTLLLFESILADEGYRILTAASGSEALRIAQTEPVDLILLDVVMPGMDGYETCKQLKSIPATQHIPVIFLTILAETQDEEIGLNLGAVDYLVKPVCAPILKARVRNHMSLKKFRDSIESLCMIDSLTGIPNRRYFEMILEKEWRRSLRTQDAISLFLIDIDQFVAYNRTYGRLAGDMCLKSVVAVLEQSAKRAGDTVIRYGGEEFALISSSLSPLQAEAFADAIAKDIRENTPVTVSVGVGTTFPRDDENFKKLVAQAESALYVSKAGKVH